MQSNGEDLPSFFKNLIFTMFYPILVALTVILILWIMGKINYRGRLILRDKYISSIIITFWLLQPDVARQIFKTFTCSCYETITEDETEDDEELPISR